MSLANYKIIRSLGLHHNNTVCRAESSTKTIKPSIKRLGYSEQQRRQLLEIQAELR